MDPWKIIGWIVLAVPCLFVAAVIVRLVIGRFIMWRLRRKALTIDPRKGQEWRQISLSSGWDSLWISDVSAWAYLDEVEQ